jgi:hypothetical protein
MQTLLFTYFYFLSKDLAYFSMFMLYIINLELSN